MDDEQISELRSRREEITRVIEAMRIAWPFFSPELKRREIDKTGQLITSNDEEIRGRIKELQDLQELPSDLNRELEDINAALSEMDAAI